MDMAGPCPLIRADLREKGIPVEKPAGFRAD
jgi:hypothetical protein